MIKNFLLIFCLINIATVAYGDPRVRANVTVLDQDGNKVPNAYVGVVFYKDDGSETERGRTDGNGESTITGFSKFPVVVVARKDVYYETRRKNVTISRNENGKKVYFDPEVELVIRKIKNPIPMYARAKMERTIPVVDKPVGFDLIECDWVAPYGKGKQSDFILEISGYWDNADNYEANLKVTFSNKGDGLIPFKGFFTSKIRSPYEAPKTGYLLPEIWHRSRKFNPNVDTAGIPKITMVKENKKGNYFFRVRTVLDENGNVKEALYGKIYGDFYFGVDDKKREAGFTMTYYLNPTVNDRNIEFDPKQNLFKKLTSLESPNMP